MVLPPGLSEKQSEVGRNIHRAPHVTTKPLLGILSQLLHAIRSPVAGQGPSVHADNFMGKESLAQTILLTFPESYWPRGFSLKRTASHDLWVVHKERPWHPTLSAVAGDGHFCRSLIPASRCQKISMGICYWTNPDWEIWRCMILTSTGRTIRLTRLRQCLSNSIPA